MLALLTALLVAGTPMEKAFDEISFASRMVSRYEENEFAADEIYKGHTMSVLGIVDEVRRDLSGKPYVTLGFKGAVRRVRCAMAENEVAQLARLKPGDAVVLRGVGAGKVLINPALTDCKVRWVEPASHTTKDIERLWQSADICFSGWMSEFQQATDAGVSKKDKNVMDEANAASQRWKKELGASALSCSDPLIPIHLVCSLPKLQPTGKPPPECQSQFLSAARKSSGL